MADEPKQPEKVSKAAAAREGVQKGIDDNAKLATFIEKRSGAKLKGKEITVLKSNAKKALGQGSNGKPGKGRGRKAKAGSSSVGEAVAQLVAAVGVLGKDGVQSIVDSLP